MKGRIGYVRVTPELICLWMKAHTNLPEDARVLFFQTYAPSNVMEMWLEASEFAEIAEGDPVPRIELGPK